MNRLTAFLLIGLLTFAACNSSDDEGEEYRTAATNELKKLNDQYDSALIKMDTAFFKSLYADEFIMVTTEGKTRNKQQQIFNLVNSGLKIEYGKSDEVEVRVFDSSAVLTGRFIGKATVKDNIIDIRERYSTTWVRRNGEWKMVSEHASNIQ
jgi:hypothetical protein